ncbi:MAG: AsmA family protein, partial [Bacteroidales bacterium]|nr:AsmA family protein [Bacteroidales bacterium]
MPRYAVVTLKVIASLLGIFAGLILVIHFALSPAVLTSLINKYGNKYIDGNLNFGKAGLSMFSHFPNASLTLEDFSITYPADRFKAVSKEGVSGELMFHGCGEKADTLASFKEFSASLNLFTLLTGKINIPYINLEK